MYNETQKRAFIESYTSSDSTMAKIIQIFSWFEPFEENWGSDLSLQNDKELQPVIDKLTGVRIKSATTIITILKEYVKWSIRNGYDVNRGVFNVKINATNKIQDQMVSSPLQLKMKLDHYFEKVEENTIDITYRIFLWMAFAGLEDNDAVRVTSDCVDLENLRINFEGHSYELYKECREDFKKACELTDFVYIHPLYVSRKERAEGNVIMRGIRSSTVNIKTVRPIINKKIAAKDEKERIKEDIEVKDRQKSYMSYNRIYLSGIFYRAFEMERAGIPVDFSDIVAKKIQNKEYKTSSTRTITSISNQYERELRADYEKWKCAFDS